ncbi:probable pseudouridine-5'-phosphatase [Pectinophora gossypiella]|uniref:probable pseudouridine-5'-phosphatase n=1 Tax=Pectinophora gossypiella TaxID=13191 RepID=UPI00214E919A|nr:probable pseudouridine-5'-phosphatase [Pectinophora gossypiella]
MVTDSISKVQAQGLPKSNGTQHRSKVNRLLQDVRQRIFREEIAQNALIIWDPNKRCRCVRPVTHCIFDLDGTILDSEIVYHKVLKHLCAKYGREYTAKLQSEVYGGTDRDISIKVVETLKLPIEVRVFEEQVIDLTNKYIVDVPVKPGAERLLKHLYESSVPTALATNSTEQAVKLHLAARPKLFSYFHHIVTATDSQLKRGKPHPQIYLLAASRFTQDPKPANCLVFEDSPTGLLAGYRAGMQVVVIPSRKFDREQINTATLFISSLTEFKPEIFGLPPFRPQPRKIQG